jgi:mycothiol synthase
MVEVRAACDPVDGTDEAVTVEDLANFIGNPAGFDPARDVLLAEVEGRVVGYGWVSHRVESAGDEIHMVRGFIHPSWRRHGLGSALLDRLQSRALAWESRPEGRRPSFLQAYVSETEAAAQAFVQGRGFEPVRYAFKMERDLGQPIPALPLPAGLQLRPAQESQYRAIWEAQREAFQDHWGYTPWPEENYRRFVSFPHYDPSLWRVAWDGDQVAGMVLGYINREENERYARRLGYTEDIAVRRPWRRRGLASALIARSLSALQDRGMTEAALSVDAENPSGALRVYERLGYRRIKQWTVFRRRLVPPSAEGGPSSS